MTVADCQERSRRKNRRHWDTVWTEQMTPRNRLRNKRTKGLLTNYCFPFKYNCKPMEKYLFCKPMDKLFLFENKNSLKSQMTDRVPLWRGNTHHAPCCHGKVQNLLTIYCLISQIRETCSSPAPGGKLHFSPTSAMTDDSCPDDLWPGEQEGRLNDWWWKWRRWLILTRWEEQLMCQPISNCSQVIRKKSSCKICQIISIRN